MLVRYYVAEEAAVLREASFAERETRCRRIETISTLSGGLILLAMLATLSLFRTAMPRWVLTQSRPSSSSMIWETLSFGRPSRVDAPHQRHVRPRYIPLQRAFDQRPNFLPRRPIGT